MPKTTLRCKKCDKTFTRPGPFAWQSPPCFVRENRGDDSQLRELVFGCPIGKDISLWHHNLERGQGDAHPRS